MEITSQTNVQVRFTIKDGDHEYTDALYLTPEEHERMTPEDIEARQQERFNNWKAVVTAPPVELSDEQKAAMEEQRIASLKAQFETTRAQILEALPDDESRLAFVQETSAKVEEDTARLETAVAASAEIVKGIGVVADVEAVK